MIEFLESGGITMAFLGLCSILAIAVVLEKVIKLRKKKVIPDEKLSTIDTFLDESLWDKAENYCREHPGTFTNIILAALENRNVDQQELRDTVEESGRRGAAELEKRLPILSTIAAVSPLLGLFGTVIGMIKVFNIISVEGTGTQSLSAGIAEALITTATGLAIAIPSLVAYNYFNNKVSEFVSHMENYSLKVVRKIKASRQKNEIQRKKK
jgi:biopolymer transport protein ExbB